MLTEFALRNLWSRTTLYKIADRHGIYVVVSPVGTISFHYEYRTNGPRDAPTIGRMVVLSSRLELAWKKLLDARRTVFEAGPVVEKRPQ